jgi:hypothetical protein
MQHEKLETAKVLQELSVSKQVLDEVIELADEFGKLATRTQVEAVHNLDCVVAGGAPLKVDPCQRCLPVEGEWIQRSRSAWLRPRPRLCSAQHAAEGRIDLCIIT